MLNVDEYLAHYGVKGQKHGERRWQNPDGTLTPEGRIHYGVGEGQQKSGTKDYKKSAARYLTDEELRNRNNRMQLEYTYRTNIENQHPIRKEIKSTLKKMFIQTAIGVGVKAMTKMYDSAYTNGQTYLREHREANQTRRVVAAAQATRATAGQIAREETRNSAGYAARQYRPH